jgi:1,2-diacylglycerol 3-beta-glucosyltransferase
MSPSPWSDDDSFTEVETPNGEVVLEERLDYSRGLSGRRLKSAVLLVGLWGTMISLHIVSWGPRFIFILLGALWLHALRMVLAQPRAIPAPLAAEGNDCPQVSLMVAAKDEAAVISRLVHDLCTVDYPIERYEVWVIDDNSQDNTPQVLKQLQQQYPHLKVFRRPAQATGGKSGALNQVWPLTQGEFIAIFDADARVAPNLLRSALPLFDDRPDEDNPVGAVQVRKIISNPDLNFLTRGQSVEMIVDAYFQQQRTAIGGIGELRGNGEFLRRKALEACGGFNEETITDDLDLTFRLGLDRWDVEFLLQPGVEEEGVTTLKALWHQRNRWAEGGYQRYLDYWRLIATNRMGALKSFDAIGFLIIQYLLPLLMIPDVLTALYLGETPMLAPMTTLSVGLPLLALFNSIRRLHRLQHGTNPPVLSSLAQAIQGLTYMLHWIVIMAVVTLRMAILPKRLKWVKTLHVGTEH